MDVPHCTYEATELAGVAHLRVSPLWMPCAVSDCRVADAPICTVSNAAPDAAPEFPVVTAVPEGVIPSKQLASVTSATSGHQRRQDRGRREAQRVPVVGGDRRGQRPPRPPQRR